MRFFNKCDKQMNGWMDRWTNHFTYRWMDRQMDKWKGGQTNPLIEMQ